MNKLLLSQDRIKQINSHWVWTHEEKKSLLDHIQRLESMIDPAVLAQATFQDNLFRLHQELENQMKAILAKQREVSTV